MLADVRDGMRELFFWWVFDRPPEEACHEGLRLLEANLTSRQRDQLEQFNFFDVVGSDSGWHYRIHFDDCMNVEQLDTSGKSIATLCFLPKGRLPVGDTVLAQKIALELFETEALRIATRTHPSQAADLPCEFRY